MTDCGIYSGEDIITAGINIKNGDDLTKVIKELVNSNLDVKVALSWNATTRQLCLVKNGNVVSCQTIADTDDQYLAVSGTKLQIWKNGTPPIKINEVDLAATFAQTPLTLHSTSLVISQGGTAGHDATINVVPSADLGNALKAGSDGKPFVAAPPQGITDVVIANGECITWNRAYLNGKITYTPVIDWACVSSHVCPICIADTIEPINLNVTPG